MKDITSLSKNLLPRWPCLFFAGYQCAVCIRFCQCEKEFLQLLRLELWGATPTRPSLAFSLGFMELVHSLNLECQVALKDVSSAIQFLETNKILPKVCIQSLYI
jgi:hypothetical protein